MAEKRVFQYVQIKSFVYPDFWYKLAEIKLDVEKLEERDRQIYGSYSNFNAKNCLIELDTTSFNSDFNASKSSYPFHGTLKNLNTIEAFKNCDKTEILKAEGKRLIDRIDNGACINDPSLLSSFVLLSYSDLKKYNFYYWCGFPALIELVVHEVMPSKMITDEFTQEIIDNFTQNYRDLEHRQAAFFSVTGSLEIKLLKDVLNNTEQDLTSLYFCFSDPSEFEDPGWMLRNFLLLLLKVAPSLKGKIIKILSIRQDIKQALTPSRIFYVELPTEFNFDKTTLKWTGWERTAEGKLMPKGVSMGSNMDPMKVAEHFSTLNLKLMKWRLLPSLNLDIIKRQKCLLFGAGTLGCAIARSLLSWGIVNISFVDCGHVAYSNPVRQSLFIHADAAQNKFKATAAAERLKEILPSVQATGHVLQIPMPGHAVGGSAREKFLESIHKIVDLIKQHDILFLITDSRESRWLCTMLGAFYGKTVITSALGFESYLVMRHGVRSDEFEAKDPEVDGLKCIAGSKLGCYFCNDVTAPGNSTRDRTLDQQCTVTRPGVSSIAASVAVELVVSLLQHEKKATAPAYYQMKSKQDATIPEGILGVLPHSIRGYLSSYSIILPATERFNQCIACSEKVLNEYEAHGDEFLLQVFDSADYLETVTGISETMTEYDDDDINADFDATDDSD